MNAIRIIGGGAKSARLDADVCRCARENSISCWSREDVAMWGAAMLAGNAIGVFGDLKQTAKVLRHRLIKDLQA